MPINHNDVALFRLSTSWRELASADNTLATATHAARPGHQFVITKIEASYSNSGTSGLLQVKFGTAVVAEKYIHGAGAMDFGDPGLVNPTANQAVSAELAASGSPGVRGSVTLFGFELPS